jgi:hypothetical protein
MVEKPLIFIVEEKENLAQVQLGRIKFTCVILRTLSVVTCNRLYS